jgi:hypothetical protein
MLDGGGVWALSGGLQWTPEFRFGGQTLTSSVSVNTNAWTHVAIGWTAQVSDAGGDAGTGIEDVSLYVNGSLVASGPISFIEAGSPATFLIGGDASGPADFTGLIDEVTLYGGELSAVDMQNIYTAGQGGKCQCVTSGQCPLQTPTCNTATMLCQ